MHVKRIHLKEPKIQKEKVTCDICATPIVNLSLHKRRVHSGRNHDCDKCEKRFSSPNDLAEHEKEIHNVGTKLFDFKFREKIFDFGYLTSALQKIKNISIIFNRCFINFKFCLRN